MNSIALITFEYPPDTGTGGIATYMFQLAHCLAGNNIRVEVICASPLVQETIQASKHLRITKIKTSGYSQFRKLAARKAAEIHQASALQLIEVPDYGAIGLYIKEYLPLVPLVVKLHTPVYLVGRLNATYRPVKKSWFRDRGYKYLKDREYKAVMEADFILSPSLSLRDIIAKEWNINAEKILHVPNLYVPNDAYLGLKPNAGSNVILYTGRLETRKGVYNFVRAIPQILQQIPDAKFMLLGYSDKDPFGKGPMKDFLINLLSEYRSSVTFVDHVPLCEMPGYYDQAAICIFPSLWENFPNVCLEAMSAAKIIIASREGGMPEMLHDVDSGILVDPFDIDAIASACVQALKNKHLLSLTAEQGRDRILKYYAGDLIPELLSLYRRLAVFWQAKGSHHS